MEQRNKDLANTRASIDAIHANSEHRANMAMQALGELNLCFSTMLHATQAQEMADREFLNKRIDVTCAEAAASLAVKWSSMATLLRQQGEKFRDEVERLDEEIERLRVEQRAAVAEAVRMSQTDHTEHVDNFHTHIEEFQQHMAFTQKLEDRLAQHVAHAKDKHDDAVNMLASQSGALNELREWSKHELQRIDDDTVRLSGNVAEAQSF